MTATARLDLAAEVTDAHAASTLAAADHLDVSFSSGGLAFTTKWQRNALADVQARLTPLGQCVTLTGATPRPWTVQAANSQELSLRLARLRSGSRRLRWQPEDLGVFAVAAIWNYLTLPLLIQHAEHVHLLPIAEGARRLRITLPATLAGHGRVQTLHIGADSLICRHDYTATALRDLGAGHPENHSIPELRRRTRRHYPHRLPTARTPAARPEARLDSDQIDEGSQGGTDHFTGQSGRKPC